MVVTNWAGKAGTGCAGNEKTNVCFILLAPVFAQNRLPLLSDKLYESVKTKSEPVSAQSGYGLTGLRIDLAR